MRYDFAELKKQNSLALQDLKAEGKSVVGTFCTYSPKELIYAAGAVPVSLCASDEGPINAAHAELPRNLCPLIKASYGYAVTKKCPYMNASDVVVGETTCDGKKKMYELLAKYKEVRVLELPNMTNKRSLELWTQELQEFKGYLEQRFGVKITDEKLKETIELFNEERDALNELMELGKLNPTPISGSEMHQVLFASDYIYDKREKIRMLRSYVKALREKDMSGTKRKKRIIITGCPSGGIYEKVVKQIDKRVDILKSYYNTDEDLVYQEIALYKLATDKFIRMGGVEDLIRKYDARILEINEDCVVVEMNGHYEETQALFHELSDRIGVLQFIRSGRVAITRSRVERLSDMLSTTEEEMHQKGGSC